MDTAGDQTEFPHKRKKRVLKVDEILAERSGVKAMEGKPRGSKRPRAKAFTDKVEKIIKQGKVNTVAKKQMVPQTIQDIWADDSVPLAAQKMPSRINPPKAVVAIKAVEVAHPGASYNPSHEDHQELLQLATDIELKRLEEASVGSQIRKDQLVKLQNAGADATMNVDLCSDDDEADEEEETPKDNAEQTEAVSTNIAKIKRKSKSVRNKEKKRKEEQMRKEAEEKKLKVLQDAADLEKIQKELEEEERQRQERKAKEAQNAVQPERISTLPFKELAPDVALTEELSESFRELKPQGNLFKDRFNVLQKRNLVEPRLPVTLKRRYKLKSVEKHSYRNFK